MDILTSGERVCPLGYNTSRVLLLAASLLCLFVSCNPKDDPKPEPGPGPEPEEVVSKGAYKHVVIIGVDGAEDRALSYPVKSPFPSIFRVAREAHPEAKLASFVSWYAINNGIIEHNLGVEMGPRSPS